MVRLECSNHVILFVVLIIGNVHLRLLKDKGPISNLSIQTPKLQINFT